MAFSRVVTSKEQYHAVPQSERYSYDVLAVWGLPGLAKDIVADQVDNNKGLKWLHSLSAGVDEYCSLKSFRESNIILTNAKGAFAHVLAEYIALGMLYFTKKVESF